MTQRTDDNLVDHRGVPSNSRGYDGFPGRIEDTLAGSEPAWRRRTIAGPDAPNIVLIVVDDLGFSDIGPYGSEIRTPALDRLAGSGVRFTNYHTAPACSPARAALLTGLNPHRAGYGFVAAADPGFPGLRMEIADDVCTLPEVLRDAGYATCAVGKWHLANDSCLHDGADKSSWPVQRGFERYYGSMEGMNSFFHPNRLIADNSPVDATDAPDDYYLTDDLTERATSFITSVRAGAPHKPIFLYFAHVAVHAPLGAKPGDLERYRGAYSDGWDVLRAQRLARQKEQGLFPPGLPMPPRSQPGLEVPPWTDVPERDQDRLARYMEVYAAMVDNVDQSLAAVVDTFEQLGELDNTIIIFTSDNGGSHEGGPDGTRSYFSQFIHGLRLPDHWNRDSDLDLDLIGGPRSMAHYPRGWGLVSNTPFRYYKTFCHAGGVRVPFILSWPAGERRGLITPGTRRQYQYVTDVLPTILALTEIEHPKIRHNVPAKAVDGTEFTQVLSDALAKSRHIEQYSEFGGHRGFYRNGWKIVAAHQPGTPVQDEEWELFDVAADPNEMHNLAAAEPTRTEQLAAAWRSAAWHNTVFPMLTGDPVSQARRRPEDRVLAESVRLLAHTPKLERYRSAKLIQLRSFEVSIEIDYRAGQEGILVAHGDQGGGYLIYVTNSKLCFGYNEYGNFHLSETTELTPGRPKIVIRAQAIEDFRWSFVLTVNDEPAGTLGPVQMMLGAAPFSGIEVGRNTGGPVHWDLYQLRGSFPFDGIIHSVVYRPGTPAPYDPEAVMGIELAAAVYYD